MKVAAALVHAFTASGAVAAFMAALAVSQRDWEQVFLWLGIAFLIDGIDGTFARRVGVKERLPRFSGETLDLVVDFVTYVFVPVLALRAAGYLDGAAGIGLASLILLSSLFHFADTASKADDLSFVGFPAIWNIVAFYVFVFAIPEAWTHVLIVVASLMAFVPMKWVHPLRVVRLRPVTIAATIAWSIAALAAVLSGFSDTPWLARAVLIAVGFYGVALAVLPGRDGVSTPQ